MCFPMICSVVPPLDDDLQFVGEFVVRENVARKDDLRPDMRLDPQEYRFVQ